MCVSTAQIDRDKRTYGEGTWDGEDDDLLALPRVGRELGGCIAQYIRPMYGIRCAMRDLRRTDKETLLTNTASEAVLELGGVGHGGELALGDGVSDLDRHLVSIRWCAGECGRCAGVVRTSGPTGLLLYCPRAGSHVTRQRDDRPARPILFALGTSRGTARVRVDIRSPSSQHLSQPR